MVPELIHRLRRAVLLLGLMALAPSLAAAQEIVMEASAGLQTYYRPGRWTPVVVTITNTPRQGAAGDDSLTFRGSIALDYASHSSNPGRVEFRTDVEVPAFTTQRYVLFARFHEPVGIAATAVVAMPEVRLLSPAGRILQTRPMSLTPVSKDQVLIGIVTDTPRSLAFPIPRGAGGVYQTVTITPRELHDSWAGYDGLDVLAFPGWPDAASTPGRIRALREWAAMGGTLLFLGGANTASYADPFLEGMLPVALQGSRSATVSSAGFAPGPDGVEALVSRASAAPGAEVLASALVAGEETVLLARQGVGTGQIVFVGLDLLSGAPPLRAQVAEAFFSILPFPSMLDWRYLVHDHLGRATLVTGAAARPPNLGLIILLCVLYTALVGPVNFFLLARRQRIQLAWITVPAIVFLFSGLTYAFGTASKGGEDIARQTTLIETVEGESEGRMTSYISVFAARAGRFQAEPLEEAATLGDAARWTRVDRFLDQGWTSIADATGTGGTTFGQQAPVLRTEGRQVRIDRWPLRTFDTAQFELRGPAALRGPISSNARIEAIAAAGGYRFAGVVANDTEHDFPESYLFFGGQAYPLGPLPSGQGIDLAERDMAFSIGRDSVTFLRSAGGGGWRDIETLLAPGADDSDAEIARENARKLLFGMFEPSPATRVLPPMAGRVFFAGIAEDPGLGIRMAPAPDRGSQGVIVLARLFPEPPAAGIALPPRLVQHHLAGFQSDSRFEINARRSGPPVFEMNESRMLLFFESPFRGAGVEVAALGGSVASNAAETSSNLFFEAFPLVAGDPALLPASGMARNPGGSFATRWNGRGIARFGVERSEDQQPGGGLITARRGSTVEVERVGVGLQIGPRELD